MTVALVLVGMVAGATLTWAHFRGQLRAQQSQLDARDKALRDAEAEHITAMKQVKLRDRQLALASAQRDDYAKIASTHEVQTPRWEAGEWVRKVWKERRYSGHPAKNLEALREDFAPFAEEHVLLSVDLELLGGWKALLEDERRRSSITTPLSAGETMIFEGPGARVLDQFRTFLHDDDTGFFNAEDERWIDADSPMVWRISMDVMHGAMPSNVEFVEVLRVQQELEEVVIERPVVRVVPDDVASSLNQHTKEEIVGLIEAVLEVRELGFNERLAAEKAALPPALHRPPSS
ncbi:MAG: hypothetical protein AAGA54_18545 [Myxococcota bacterium]